ncbi:hypothetical protein BC827DRAFT_1249413 [Russula dissimulans]|nr:hypothetical protein BC827DRAFT_1249413 [Russula dissimulans]
MPTRPPICPSARNPARLATRPPPVSAWPLARPPCVVTRHPHACLALPPCTPARLLVSASQSAYQPHLLTHLPVCPRGRLHTLSEHTRIPQEGRLQHDGMAAAATATR